MNTASKWKSETRRLRTREAIAQAVEFDYRLKKQSGGSGEFAHVSGRIEPCDRPFVFENRVVGGAIPKAFIPACEKGCEDALTTSPVEGYPVLGIKVVLEGGSYHAVDSSEYAFRTATQLAVRAIATSTVTRSSFRFINMSPVIHYLGSV